MTTLTTRHKAYIVGALRRAGFVNVDISAAGDCIAIRGHTPVPNAYVMLGAIDPLLADYGLAVVDVWDCLAAADPYRRFSQVKVAPATPVT